MLMTFDKASKLIEEGQLLHIAGTENLIKKLPQGNWIGGSTEYFMAEEGGRVTDELLYVTVIPYIDYRISAYDENTIQNVANDAFDNGFSIVIVPFDSNVHKSYARGAAGFEGMFLKNIAGWVSGLNLNKTGQTPVAINGQMKETYSDKAVVLHIGIPDKNVNIGIINIFTQDESAPVIEFIEEGFSVEKCLVDGKEVVFAEYITQNNIDTKLPLVGDYSGVGVNISFKSIENNIVNFYAPVFNGIKYRMAKSIGDYAGEFKKQLLGLKDVKSDFSCNCILNFLYGELEDKNIEAFAGPITFGEIAYQLVNQTLVYVTVS